MSEVREWIAAHNEDAVVLDDLDDAVIGVAENGGAWCAVYDVERILKILIRRDRSLPDDALEHFHFNIQGSFNSGANAPLFLWPYDGTEQEQGTGHAPEE